MPLFIIPEIVRRENNLRYFETVEDFPKKIRLYNRNARTVSTWRVDHRPAEFYGTVVRRKTCPKYWANVVRPWPIKGEK